MNPLKFLKHPLGQAVAILVVAYLVVDFGIPLVPPLVGVPSAPVPNTVLLQYLLTALVGVLLYVSSDEQRWREFKAPLHRVLVDPGQSGMRRLLLVVVPALVAFVTYGQVRPSVSAPASFRSIHPAPPGQITYQGNPMTLAGLENPLRADGSIEEDYQVGKRVYYQNCLPCHGDALDGRGHFARGFNPAPLNFRDAGTISQLTESFVFWRIAKGGPGLPSEGTPWNSSMPAWEEFLTEEETWAVIIFLYEQSGSTPRTWEEGGGEGPEEGA